MLSACRRTAEGIGKEKIYANADILTNNVRDQKSDEPLVLKCQSEGSNPCVLKIQISKNIKIMVRKMFDDGDGDDNNNNDVVDQICSGSYRMIRRARPEG